MSEYKLVPVEPTPEMLGAVSCWDTVQQKAKDDYQAMLAAAPAVQGEPVAFCEDAALSIAERTFSTEVDEQPAEDVIQYARRLHELYAAPQPVEQQPAPDVPSLAKALRQYRHNDGSGLVFGYDKLLVDQYVAGLVEALEAVVAYDESVEDTDGNLMMHYADMMKKVRAALAAYRKQGGEV